jgi:hypothetical protein
MKGSLNPNIAKWLKSVAGGEGDLLSGQRQEQFAQATVESST